MKRITLFKFIKLQTSKLYRHRQSQRMAVLTSLDAKVQHVEDSHYLMRSNSLRSVTRRCSIYINAAGNREKRAVGKAKLGCAGRPQDRCLCMCLPSV